MSEIRNVGNFKKLEPLLRASITMYLKSPDKEKYRNQPIDLIVIPDETRSEKMKLYVDELQNEGVKISRIDDYSISVEVPLDYVSDLCKRQWIKRIESVREYHEF